MAMQTADPVLDLRDQRLIAALQCDGRLSAERAGHVLGLGPRTVHRRWQALMAEGACRVILRPSWPAAVGALLLRIRVLGTQRDALAAALAAREDIPFIDLSASGDEILAVSLTRPGSRDHLVFRELPATRAVTSVGADTVLHVFAEAADWRHDVLSADERAALSSTPGPEDTPGPGEAEPDPTDRAVLAALEDDARASAAAVAARTGRPESTVRRRLARLAAAGRLRTQAVADPRRLGLPVDANVMLRVAPDRLDAAGRALAAHPAVHGAFATTGTANLQAAVWMRDLEHLYRFVSQDLAGLGVEAVETVLIGHAYHRPGRGPRHRRPG
ncbi:MULTISPECIES: AsnC family transcriptional regulator [unclassified Streptomyces]|uniref:AsnC family transcriptional regulator n=1 Tax=unclassified Streptomyces TaxID=2593676 RepID=UPI001F03DC78|nr:MULTISPECIES: AsnC family transcriptional regulator [unclassified Streptomyces]MCH0562315.1 AsnC family transcriptional regulator [Streptomyces sp. MUM 2J]MCH0572924.1 AsnC family transcriptional regulator [Streptomyces sp. MUM 136J]